MKTDIASFLSDCSSSFVSAGIRSIMEGAVLIKNHSDCSCLYLAGLEHVMDGGIVLAKGGLNSDIVRDTIAYHLKKD